MYAQHPDPFPQLKQAGQTHKIANENKRLQFVLDFFWHQDGDVTFSFSPCDCFMTKGQPHILIHDQALTTLLNLTAWLATNH